MRISDWSSDVCSSDLALRHEFTGLAEAMRAAVNVETVAGPSIENMVDQIADRAEDALDATRKNADITRVRVVDRPEEHTSELQSLMRTSYAVFCLKKKTCSFTTSINKYTLTPFRPVYNTNILLMHHAYTIITYTTT